MLKYDLVLFSINYSFRLVTLIKNWQTQVSVYIFDIKMFLLISTALFICIFHLIHVFSGKPFTYFYTYLLLSPKLSASPLPSSLFDRNLLFLYVSASSTLIHTICNYWFSVFLIKDYIESRSI